MPPSSWSYCLKVDVDGVIAALGVGGIAVSLGFQDTLSNIFGGIQIVYLGILEVGDHVIIDSTEDLVENVTWRQTTMRDFDDIIHVIPNSVINSSSVQKYEANNLVRQRLPSQTTTSASKTRSARLSCSQRMP